MNISHNISLEVLLEYKEVTFYSLKLDSNEYLETERFLMAFMEDPLFEEDLGIITKVIENIGNSGAEERHFRRAGSPKDDVGGLPGYLYTKNKLRLYAIHVSKEIVILGNGGHKTTKNYNSDPHLNECVNVLIAMDSAIKDSLNTNQTEILNRKLVGKTTFTYET